MTKNIDWSEKVKPDDWRWDAAREVCKDIARGIPDQDQSREKWQAPRRWLAPAEALVTPGSVPWVVNPRTDRVIAYHGFSGTWVGWDRGGAVIPLAFSEIVKFLRGEM